MGELADTCNNAGVGARAIGVTALGSIKGGVGRAAREVAMRWEEVKPGEVFNERRFVSRPLGKWEGGIRRLEFGKYLVGISPWSWNYAFSYMCGELAEAQLLCGFVLGMSWRLEEEISEGALARVFPVQGDQETDQEFYAELFLAEDWQERFAEILAVMDAEQLIRFRHRLGKIGRTRTVKLLSEEIAEREKDDDGS